MPIKNVFLVSKMQFSGNPEIFKNFYADADTISAPSYDADEALFQKIIDEDYAYVEWNDNLDLIMKENHKQTGACNFEVSAERFLTQRLAFAFPKNNPWIKKFDKE